MSKKKDNIDLIHNPPEPIKKPSNWQKTIFDCISYLRQHDYDLYDMPGI